MGERPAWDVYTDETKAAARQYVGEHCDIWLHLLWLLWGDEAEARACEQIEVGCDDTEGGTG